MKRFATTLLALGCVLSLPNQATPQSRQSQPRELTPSEIARIAIRSVVVIEAHEFLGTAYGTGFFVKDDLVATNYHVVKDSYEISTRLVGRDANYPCTVVAKDEENDLAILRVQGLRGYSLGLALTPAQVGQEIYVLSNPEEYEGTFTRGMVNAYRGRDMQIDAPLSHGSSGGPVLNRRAQVVAVAHASEREGQNLNFAIPVAYLARLMGLIVPASVNAGGGRRNGQRFRGCLRWRLRSRVFTGSKAWKDFWIGTRNIPTSWIQRIERMLRESCAARRATSSNIRNG